MTHEAGKGDTMRPTNHEAFSKGFDRIFGKREIEDDEPTCSSCTGPMYTQAHWQYWQCDDCGYTEYKEEMEP